RDPRPDDRGKFVDGLRSPQLAQVALCLDALAKLPPVGDAAELLALVRALRALADTKAEGPVRDRLAARLRRLTGLAHGPDRAARVVTAGGEACQGLIVYEAVDGLILQTGPAATVRLDGKQVESRGPTDTSLMPAGLLDRLSDRDIADLLAYLKALK